MPVSHIIKKSFSVLCWNIRNPSLVRAKEQALWLTVESADIIVLTECKLSQGCAYLEEYLKCHGYEVIFPQFEKSEYGVLLASKHPITPSNNYDVDYLSPRLKSMLISTPCFNEPVEIIGTYVPSRDRSLGKKVRKRLFLDNLLERLSLSPDYKHRIFCGDFNILQRDHIPHYSLFESWEYDFYDSLANLDLTDTFIHTNPSVRDYSWVGRTGDGYRYDHCFVSNSLLSHLHSSFYIHEPRLSRLSDHSVMVTKFTPTQ